MLVFINVMMSIDSTYQPVVEGWWEYETMSECFEARERLKHELGIPGQHFPIKTQAICIKVET